METVLLVEDSKLLKIAHERMLAKAGYKVVTASDGEEALKIVHQFTPDLILLDMMLPKISGEGVLRALKSDRTTADIPVIVVTGLSKRNAERLREDGANAFVEKEQLLASTQPLLDTVAHVLREAANKKPPILVSPAGSNWAPGETDAAMTATTGFVPTQELH